MRVRAIVFVAVVVAAICFCIGDLAFGTDSYAAGEVEDKFHKPGYITLVYIANGKGGGYWTSQYHPPVYVLQIKADGRNYSARVNYNRWDRTRPGDAINVRIRTGRWTGSQECRLDD